MPIPQFLGLDLKCSTMVLHIRLYIGLVCLCVFLSFQSVSFFKSIKKKTRIRLRQIPHSWCRPLVSYCKIPKISPSMYEPLQISPQTRKAKNPPLNRPSKYKSLGGLYLEIALKYKVKQSKNSQFHPTTRIAQSILKPKFPSADKPLLR